MAIKTKIQSMGGSYTESLLTTNTHLITDSVKSIKYLQAAESGVKLMLPSWVDSVWEGSQHRNVHANDAHFLKRHRCPPFHNLNISSTGIPDVKTKKEISKKVSDHGGNFTGNMSLSNTDVLICYGNDVTTTAKYKAARKTKNIQCVTGDWITDSISKGYALPYSLYTIRKSTSTPTKNNIPNPDFSMMSVIASSTTFRTSIEDTVIQPANVSYRSTPVKRKSSDRDDYETVLDKLDIKRVKRAGQCLDGCSVYVAGFSAEQKDKLCKILVLSGATKYDAISDRVTHALVGDPSCPEVKYIKSKDYPVSLVSIHWLIESIDKGRPADEEKYLVNLVNSEKEQFSSPLSQKGLSFLRNKTMTENDLEEVDAGSETYLDPENSIIKQYQTQGDESDTLAKLLQGVNSDFNSMRQASESEGHEDTLTLQHTVTTDGESSQNTGIFSGLKFLLINCAVEDLQASIESLSGIVLQKPTGALDFIVYPTTVYEHEMKRHNANEIVNELWVLESIQEDELVNFQHYHRPFLIKDTEPLKDCVVTISGYSSYERNFFTNLVIALGGIAQDQLARVSNTERNVLASTHLMSLEASGKKYLAAKKWKLPVVTKEWLLECGKTGVLSPESDFLLGNVKTPSSIVEESNLSRSTFKNIPETVITAENCNKTAETAAGDLQSQCKTPGVFVNSDISLQNVLTPNENKLDTLDCDNKIFVTPSHSTKQFVTPENTPARKVAATPCSQVTPVNKIMQEVRKNMLLGTPESPSPLKKPWMNISTPKTPIGAFIRPDPSPQLRKELAMYINTFPDFKSPVPKRLSTPLSELKRRIVNKLPSWKDDDSQEENTDHLNHNDDANTIKPQNVPEIPSQNTFVNTKLQELENKVNQSGKCRRTSNNFQSTTPLKGGSAVINSEPLCVEWNYTEQESNSEEPPEQPKKRVFMLSGVDNQMRQTLIKDLKTLGSEVSDLQSYDPSCTHLVCLKPARNEKTLSSMAAGKWVLHVSYVEKSLEAGRFLNEEEFEFGNPKAGLNITASFDKETKQRVDSMHWWRKEVAKRGYGAFNDVRAIVVANKREPIIRVIEAGGGVVIDVKPPFDDSVHATHCLLEPRSVSNKYADYVPLAKQGIYCVNTLYISDYLDRTSKDIRDCILPNFEKYYK